MLSAFPYLFHLCQMSKISEDCASLITHRLGTTIATHPLKVILATLLLVSLGCVGLIYFEFETDAEKLWLPRNASFIVNKVTTVCQRNLFSGVKSTWITLKWK